MDPEIGKTESGLKKLLAWNLPDRLSTSVARTVGLVCLVLGGLLIVLSVFHFATADEADFPIHYRYINYVNSGKLGLICGILMVIVGVFVDRERNRGGAKKTQERDHSKQAD